MNLITVTFVDNYSELYIFVIYKIINDFKEELLINVNFFLKKGQDVERY